MFYFFRVSLCFSFGRCAIFRLCKKCTSYGIIFSQTIFAAIAWGEAKWKTAKSKHTSSIIIYKRYNMPPHDTISHIEIVARLLIAECLSLLFFHSKKLLWQDEREQKKTLFYIHHWFYRNHFYKKCDGIILKKEEATKFIKLNKIMTANNHGNNSMGELNCLSQCVVVFVVMNFIDGKVFQALKYCA